MGRKEKETETHEDVVVVGREMTVKSKASVPERLKLNHIAEPSRKGVFLIGKDGRECVRRN